MIAFTLLSRRNLYGLMVLMDCLQVLISIWRWTVTFYELRHYDSLGGDVVRIDFGSDISSPPSPAWEDVLALLTETLASSLALISVLTLCRRASMLASFFFFLFDLGLRPLQPLRTRSDMTGIFVSFILVKVICPTFIP